MKHDHADDPRFAQHRPHAGAGDRLPGVRPAGWPARDPAARLAVGRARLRRRRAAVGRRRLPRAGAVAARLRADAVPRSRDPAQRAAGGAGRGCAGLHGRAVDSAGRSWPATTGAAAPPAWWRRCGRSAWPGWSRSPATPSRTSPRRAKPAAAEQEYRYWYQWYFHTERGRAGLAANRGGACAPAVAAVVAELGVRRCNVPAHRRQFRQSGFR